MASIDWGNPMTSGLLFFASVQEGAFTNLANSGFSDIDEIPSAMTATIEGNTIRTGENKTATFDVTGSTQLTSLTVATKETLDTVSNTFSYVYGINNWDWMMTRRHSDGIFQANFQSGGNSGGTLSAFPLSEEHSMMAVLPSANFVIAGHWFVDGTKEGVASLSPSTTIDPITGWITIGDRSSGSRWWDGTIEYVAIWDRDLSDAEAASFQADPYQFVITSGGGTGGNKRYLGVTEVTNLYHGDTLVDNIQKGQEVPVGDITVSVTPLIDGTIDTEQLAGSTQPDLVVTGTVAHKASASVSTSTLSLPTKSPTVYLYNDWSDLNVGDMLTNKASDVGTYLPESTGIGNDNVRVADYGRSSDECFGLGPALNNGFYPILKRQIPSPTNEMYCSYAYKNTVWPGATGWPNEIGEPYTYPADSAWKMTWFTYALDVVDQFSSNICTPTYTGETKMISGGNSHNWDDNNPNEMVISNRAITSWNYWNVIEWWMRDSTVNPISDQADGELTVTSTQGRSTQRNKGKMYKDDAPYNYFNYAGWLDNNGFEDIRVDDIYLADTCIRVLVGNKPNIDDCTKIAVQLSSNHTANGFDVSWRLGDMNPATESLYMFVMDDENQSINSVGKLLN